MKFAAVLIGAAAAAAAPAAPAATPAGVCKQTPEEHAAIFSQYPTEAERTAQIAVFNKDIALGTTAAEKDLDDCYTAHSATTAALKTAADSTAAQCKIESNALAARKSFIAGEQQGVACFTAYGKKQESTGIIVIVVCLVVFLGAIGGYCFHKKR